MPRLALALCALWFISLFVFRSLLQWKRTGSTGFKGVHGSVGSVPWIAGVSTGLGLVLAPLGPLAAMFDLPGGTALVESPPLHWAGAALALSGTLGALMAQIAMGNSWRVGVDESEATALVTRGPFAWVRNPIFSFFWLTLIGLVLLVPNPLSLLVGSITALGIELQVRAVEEPYLRRTHGEAYTEYASRVGRFVPGAGMLQDRGQPERARPGAGELPRRQVRPAEPVMERPRH